jgi:hypothetical protein
MGSLADVSLCFLLVVSLALEGLMVDDHRHQRTSQQVEVFLSSLHFELLAVAACKKELYY